MMKFVYIGLFNIIQILRIMIFPLTWWLLSRFKVFGKLHKRKILESSYDLLPPKGFAAQFCFHFSSVGELEQCSPVINFLIDKGSKIELLFTSDSVSKTVNTRYGHMQEQVRILPLPIISYNLIKINLDKIVTAHTISMVRYDFFPELILLARKRRSILLSATLINKRLSFFNITWHKFIYSSFDKIFTSTEGDRELFLRILGIKTTFAELRIDQIRNRIDKVSEDFFNMPNFKNNAILFGSVWPSDIINLNKAIQEFINSGGTFFSAT